MRAATLMVLSLCAWPLAWAQSAEDEASVTLTGRVPLLCEGRVESGTGNSAKVEGYCNGPNGYRLVLAHEPVPAGSVVFGYRGADVPAGTGGRTVLHDSDRPGRIAEALELVKGSPAALGRVALTVESR